VFGKRGIAQTRIAYVNDGLLRIIDSDGARTRSITTGKGALSPAWSPTGESVVYTVLGNAGTQVEELDVRTGGTRRISQIRAGLNITPVYQPGGNAILYAQGTGNGTDLVLANLDSSGARKLTVGKGTDNTSPSYSPDGRQIAFISGKSGQPQVYIMDADGSNIRLLTPYAAGVRSYRASPDWSPDGRAVAYEQQNGNFQVWMIDLRDRIPKQLTSEGENEDPSWAPDGRHLVFSSSRSGEKQLWILDAESGRARQLTHNKGARLAAWSPNSRHSGSGNIFAMTKAASLAIFAIPVVLGGCFFATKQDIDRLQQDIVGTRVSSSAADSVQRAQLIEVSRSVRTLDRLHLSSEQAARGDAHRVGERHDGDEGRHLAAPGPEWTERAEAARHSCFSRREEAAAGSFADDS